MIEKGWPISNVTNNMHLQPPPNFNQPFGDNELILTQLPAYENPPVWIPPHKRTNNPDYDNPLEEFLPRVAILQRSHPDESLGFNIRGGEEHLCGIYISKVIPQTVAQRSGLQEGDKIISANGILFEHLEHHLAVKALKSSAVVNLVVQFFPYGYSKTYERSYMLAKVVDSVWR